MGKIGAAMGGLSMSIMEDAMVKNVHSAYAAEHFEIASYITIKAAAEELGDTETTAICDDILEDEYAMAEWVLEQIPLVVAEHVTSLKD
jgi:ferritin-like metal-binding protein YciE